MRTLLVRGALVGIAVLLLASPVRAQALDDSFTGVTSVKLDVAEDELVVEQRGSRLTLSWGGHFYFVQPGEDPVSLNVSIQFANPGVWLSGTANFTLSPTTRPGVNTVYQKFAVATTEAPSTWSGQERLSSLAELFDNKEQVITITVTLKQRTASLSGRPLDQRDFVISPVDFLLMRSAKLGDLRGIELLLSKGADANAADVHGISALMMAAGRGHPAAVRTLLDNGANPRAKSKGSGFIRSADGSRLPGGNTALHAACYAGRAEIVGLLLAKEAEVNVKSGDGWTPVMAAAFSGDPRAMQLLLQAGGDIGGINETGYSAAALALINGNAACYRILMSRGGVVRVPWKKDDV
jgi:uncharacterized protein